MYDEIPYDVSDPIATVTLTRPDRLNAWSAFVLELKTATFFLPDYTSINRFMAASSGERSVASLNETGHLH